MQASPKAPFLLHGLQAHEDAGGTTSMDLSHLLESGSSGGSCRRSRGDVEPALGVSSTAAPGDPEYSSTGSQYAGQQLEKRDESSSTIAASIAARLGSSVDHSPPADNMGAAWTLYPAKVDRILLEAETRAAEDPRPDAGLSVSDPSQPKKLQLQKNMDPQGLDPDIEMGLTTVRGKIHSESLNTSTADADVDGERICRVCHVDLYAPGTGEPMELGCACKQDLALCHRPCAEEWFKVRGNRSCEICGQTVQNLLQPATNQLEAAASGSSSQARLDAAAVTADGGNNGASGLPRTSGGGRLRQVLWQRKAVRNFLLATLVVLKTGKQGGAVVAAGSHPCTHEAKSVTMGLSPLRSAVGLINSTPLRIPKGSFIHC
ncbi:unnamed protein product [Sphagnum compactum]